MVREKAELLGLRARWLRPREGFVGGSIEREAVARNLANGSMSVRSVVVCTVF